MLKTQNFTSIRMHVSRIGYLKTSGQVLAGRVSASESRISSFKARYLGGQSKILSEFKSKMTVQNYGVNDCGTVHIIIGEVSDMHVTNFKL